MYSTYLTYHLWGQHWQSQLEDARFLEAFSSDKDTLWVKFQLRDGSDYSIEIKFVGGEMLWMRYSGESLSFNKNKHLPQFKELNDVRIVDVIYKVFDRVLILAFESGFHLVFKGFGRFGNVLLFPSSQATVPINIFRQNLKIDWDETNLLSVGIQLNKEHNLTIDSITLNELKSSGEKVESIKIIPQEIPQKIVQSAETSLSDNNNWSLSLKQISSAVNILWNHEAKAWNYTLENEMSHEERIIQLEKSIPNYIQWFYFQEFRSNFIEKAAQKLKSWNSQINQHLKAIQDIADRRNYRELGDLLLAHAHTIKPGVTNALIMDYYTSQRIRVKLDPQLNAAENAQKYYRKAKNEYLEKQKLEEALEGLMRKTYQLDNDLMVVKDAASFRDIKVIQRGNSNKLIHEKGKSTQTSPYKLYNLEGYEIWVGKNAKSNDEMIKLCSKNDLWFHVKDFTGSHVIIRQQGPSYSSQVIEKAAQLAAFHSKAKHQTLVQVGYTPRKFISKSKKSAPGQVNVLKESYIDVQPKDF